MTDSKKQCPLEIKRDSVVKILRPESYWFNQCGTVVAVQAPPGGDLKYPITVRFESVNYAGTNTNNFSNCELEIISEPA